MCPAFACPIELGQEKVFQLVDPQPEIDRLNGAGESFVSIYEGFVRHPLEIGSNDLMLEWHNCHGSGAVCQFNDLSRRLRSIGLFEGQ